MIPCSDASPSITPKSMRWSGRESDGKGEGVGLSDDADDTIIGRICQTMNSYNERGSRNNEMEESNFT